MTNPTQQIIAEAISKGYVPEKKDKNWAIKFTTMSMLGFNEAIDSFQLEKIVELAYERGGKEGCSCPKKQHEDSFHPEYVDMINLYVPCGPNEGTVVKGDGTYLKLVVKMVNNHVIYLERDFYLEISKLPKMQADLIISNLESR